MTGQIAFNENSSIGRKLLDLIKSSDEVTFKVDKKAEKELTADDKKKKRILSEIRRSIRQANELEDTGAKTYTLEELIESL